VWLVGILAAFVLLVWLLIMGLVHVASRYYHSRLSRRILAAQAVVSLVLAMLYIRDRVPLAPPWPQLLGLPLALTLFTGLSVATLLAWRFKLQGSFDGHIGQLEQKESTLLQELDAIRDRVHMEALKLRETETHDKKSQDRTGRLRHLINQWQQEPGVARIRSLRTAEWAEQYRVMSSEGLEQRKRELLAESEEARSAGDAQRETQVNVELAVMELVVLEKERGAVVSGDGGKGAELVDRLLARQDEIAAALASVRQELTTWRRKKADYLSQRIKLEGGKT